MGRQGRRALGVGKPCERNLEVRRSRAFVAVVSNSKSEAKIRLGDYGHKPAYFDHWSGQEESMDEWLENYTRNLGVTLHYSKITTVNKLCSRHNSRAKSNEGESLCKSLAIVILNNFCYCTKS